MSWKKWLVCAILPAVGVSLTLIGSAVVMGSQDNPRYIARALYSDATRGIGTAIAIGLGMILGQPKFWRVVGAVSLGVFTSHMVWFMIFPRIQKIIFDFP